MDFIRPNHVISNRYEYAVVADTHFRSSIDEIFNTLRRIFRHPQEPRTDTLPDSRMEQS